MEAEVVQLDEYLKKAGTVYINAELRNQDFVDAALKPLTAREKQIAARITGGYHSPVMIEPLQARRIGWWERTQP